MAFSRSQGAGGQNVNKVSTKADIRFDVRNCSWMSDSLRKAVIAREPTRMNKQVRRLGAQFIPTLHPGLSPKPFQFSHLRASC